MTSAGNVFRKLEPKTITTAANFDTSIIYSRIENEAVFLQFDSTNNLQTTIHIYSSVGEGTETLIDTISYSGRAPLIVSYIVGTRIRIQFVGIRPVTITVTPKQVSAEALRLGFGGKTPSADTSTELEIQRHTALMCALTNIDKKLGRMLMHLHYINEAEF